MGDSFKGNTDFDVESIGTKGKGGQGTKQEEKDVVDESRKEKTKAGKPILGLVFNNKEEFRIFYANYA